MDKVPPRMIYYELTLWNKIEKTEDHQEVFGLVNAFCKEHSLNVIEYKVREATRPQQEEQE